MVVYPVLIVAAMLAVALGGAAHTPLWAVVVTEAILAVVLVWALMFFRDPRRNAPQDEELLVAPADGEGVARVLRVGGAVPAGRQGGGGH